MNSFMFLRKTLNANILIRNYAFKSDLKIKWVRPEKFSCIHPKKSGDLSSLPKIDLTNFMLEFRKSEELKSADPAVCQLFKLENNPRGKTIKTIEATLLDSVKRHDLDRGSIESKLARMTISIRSLQEYMNEFPRNKKTKVQLKELIDKRKKFLKYLRRWDYKRFEWILEKLDIVYKSPPSEYHWITRKDSLRKLTDIHCENIKNERLNEYKQELESQKQEFLENKIKKLEYIQKQQIECKIPVTIKNEQIEAAKQLHAKIMKNK